MCQRPTLRHALALKLIALAIFLASGCAPQPEFRLNKVEWLKQQRMHLPAGEDFDPQHRRDIADIMTALFGTPDEPHFPYLLGDDDPAHELVRWQNLQRAAGPVRSDRDGTNYGLYREHCAHCHGISGDGAGATAGLLYPYPRDFRHGKFKFKSTPLRRPPTTEDLHRMLVDGIPGTGMPTFRLLKQEDLEALVDYVRYLSIRGQFERRLIAEVPRLAEGERLVDIDALVAASQALNASRVSPVAHESGGVAADDPAAETAREQLLELVGDWLLDDTIDWWTTAQRSVTRVPSPPPALDPASPDHLQFVAQGRTLFYGLANCLQCHGDTGLGDGQQETFDDWTADWIKGANVDWRDPHAVRPFLNAGALPPHPLLPRNLRLGVFRGGDRPQDLYRRIAYGIEGTPMPETLALTEEQLWALVAYVRAMAHE